MALKRTLIYANLTSIRNKMNEKRHFKINWQQLIKTKSWMMKMALKKS